MKSTPDWWAMFLAGLALASLPLMQTAMQGMAKTVKETTDD